MNRRGATLVIGFHPGAKPERCSRTGFQPVPKTDDEKSCPRKRHGCRASPCNALLAAGSGQAGSLSYLADPSVDRKSKRIVPAKIGHVSDGPTSQSDDMTAAVDFSPRLCERSVPHRVAMREGKERKALKRRSATYLTLHCPWAEAHGYRHRLAPREGEGNEPSFLARTT